MNTLRKLRKSTKPLRQCPKRTSRQKVVTTGILVNSEDILKIFEEFNFGIVDDNVLHESLQYEVQVKKGTGNPLHARGTSFRRYRRQYLRIRRKEIKRTDCRKKVKESGSCRRHLLMTKFSDTDEFDYPILSDDLQRKHPLEHGRSRPANGQLRTSQDCIKTFADMLHKLYTVQVMPIPIVFNRYKGAG